MKRFENKAQLLRYIAEQESVSIDELWEQYEQQIDDDNE